MENEQTPVMKPVITTSSFNKDDLTPVSGSLNTPHPVSLASQPVLHTPTLAQREKSTPVRPVSPDIMGESGEADGGYQPNSEPSSEESPATGAAPGAIPLRLEDKPLPPLPE